VDGDVKLITGKSSFEFPPYRGPGKDSLKEQVSPDLIRGAVTMAKGTENFAPRLLRILTPYKKGNHPQWLKNVELYQPLPDEVRRNWVTKRSITYRLRRQALWAWRLFRLSKKYDVILTGSDGGGLLFGIAQRILRQKRIPHIYLDFYINLEGGKLKRALIRFLSRLAVQGASCALVQRTCEVESYSRAFGLRSSMFRFVPYHSTTFDFELDVRDDGYIFAGGDAARDYPLLIEAVRNLPYRVIIAALQRGHFTSISIPKNVEIVSVPGSEFLNLMAHARLLVLPLKWRPQHVGGQQTYLNAMTMGKPIIVTDLNANDYITSGVTGILTPAGDVRALKDSITMVMEDRDFAYSLGREAKKASQAFTPERFFAAVFENCERRVYD
jgi:glycosyltransferase involved in cell wall biosynthesis